MGTALLRDRRCILPVLLFLLAAPPAFSQSTPTVVTVMENVMVPMRDGVRLATDVYLPTRDLSSAPERRPTILIRTPYEKTNRFEVAAGPYFASHDYAVVIQDTRGRFKSEGIWHMLTDDGQDGVDAAAWITQQPWSNGDIGMMGTSYAGGTGHALAMAGSPYLKAIIPVDATSNPAYQSLRNAGAFELRFFNWIFLFGAPRGSRQVRDSATRAVLEEMADNRRQYLLSLPLRKGTTPLKLAPEYEEWLVQAMRHGANDAFWAWNNIIDHPERYQDIPVYLVGGWYDSYAGNTTANYAALSRQLKGPVYLIMGPWIHGKQGDDAHGQVSFGPEAAIPDPLAWHLEWFDHFLKGKDNAVGKAAPFATPVRIFVMGTGDHQRDEHGRMRHGGYWRDEHEWPLSRTRYTDYYLGEGSTLAPTAPSAARSSTSFQFDPRSPVPTIGGNISAGPGILLQGAWDQRGSDSVWNWTLPIPLSARNDVLVFQTPPLEEDVEVTGEIVVSLWASTDGFDTDFTAKLVDVHPPTSDFPGGFDMNIADGIVRGRFRRGLDAERLMAPGKAYPFTIKLYPTSNVFRKGHRIRVDVSSSNFPRFDVNPNTGEPLNDNRRTRVATNTIYHDRTHPSHIRLPVIPASVR